MKSLPKALFISHGGGPMPLLGDPGHREMVACLTDLAARMPVPEAIVVVSAHWEASVPTITAAVQPDLIYDYHGFPPESYEITYPCPGEPALAQTLKEMLVAAGIEARLDAARGLDHGVFVPLRIMYPQATIPCVQLSLVDTLDPAAHIAVGRALAGLSARNVMVIGSGFSFHNIKAFFAPPSEEGDRLNQAFEAWLAEVCCSEICTEAERADRLIHWAEAPGARFCHPREEHLLPLHVCYGAAGATCTERVSLRIMGKASSLYVW